MFVARAPELPHSMGEGPTRAEAIARIEEEIEAQLQNIRGQGGQVPVAVDEEQFSGAVTLQLSKGLHRDLVWQARSEGVEVDQLASELLAAALPGRVEGAKRHSSGNRPRHEEFASDNIGNGGNDRFDRGRPRSGLGGRYQAATGMLDDRANFIEYVRGLEHGGQGGQGGDRGGDRGGRRRRRGRGGPGAPYSNQGNGPPGSTGPGSRPQSGPGSQTAAPVPASAPSNSRNPEGGSESQ